MTLNINSNADANLARQDNIESSSCNKEREENPILTNNHNISLITGNPSLTNHHNNAFLSREVINTNNHNIASYNTHNNTLTNYHRNILSYVSTTQTNYPNNVCLLVGNHNNASLDCIDISSVNINTSLYAEHYISISKLAYKYVLLSTVFISSLLRDVHSVYFVEEK